MGYASLSPVSVFEIGSTPNTSEITISTVAGTYGLRNMDIPSWVSGKVKHAYLDVHFPWVVNNHADFNWIDTCDGIYISPDSGLNEYLGVAIPNHTLYMPSSSTFTGDVRVIGTVDLVTYVEQASGSNWLININNAVAHDNDLRLFYPYVVLRCYMETQ